MVNDFVLYFPSSGVLVSVAPTSDLGFRVSVFSAQVDLWRSAKRSFTINFFVSFVPLWLLIFCLPTSDTGIPTFTLRFLQTRPPSSGFWLSVDRKRLRYPLLCCGG